jgi:hypothetical protein
MKYFFRRRIPAAQDVLLMESGSPEVAQRALPGMKVLFAEARFHLCTCQAEVNSEPFASVLRVTDYPTLWTKLGLLVSIYRKQWSILAILCTGENLLLRWKVMAALLLPAKVLVVNENADFFWLDWENRGILRRLVANRWGVNRSEILSTLLRMAVFPVTLIFLLANAGRLYLRRAWRLFVWRLEGDRR